MKKNACCAASYAAGFLYESAREGRPTDRSVLNFQYVVRRYDNVELLRYLGGAESIRPIALESARFQSVIPWFRGSG
jgi:hypothetical protein